MAVIHEPNMAVVVEATTQVQGIAEVAHAVKMVVKHTFLELVEADKDVRCAQGARLRASSEPRKLGGHMEFGKCDSSASTRATDTDDDTVPSDNEQASVPVQAPPGVWAKQPTAGAQLVPVCVAFVPVVQQPVWKKSSRSARRRRARAMNRWFRYNMQNGEQEDDALEDAEFDDDWQVPEGGDMGSPEIDAECWPMPNLPCEVQDKKKAIKA